MGHDLSPARAALRAPPSRGNRLRVQRNEAPQPIDDTLADAMKMRAQDLIQKTHWPNIDLIGAQLNLYWSEFQIPVWRMAARSWKLWDALTESLEADGILQDYDLVFLDTPPALGISYDQRARRG